jgi:type III restriction enzyme
MLQLKFDSNQDYQLEAIRSVVDLFDGLPRRVAEHRLGDEIVANWPPYDALSEAWLLNNLRAVQERNGIDLGGLPLGLECDDGMVLNGAGNESWRYPNFTVEMETGTGKTYVYLRTIFELRQRYGFSKFVIVVPSIAIYEGVIKNYQITRAHFRALYGNEPVNLTQYDGSQLSRLRAYAASAFTEILVITLDAFNKITNNLYKPSEKLPGERRPHQYIQETRPILILDEPQNMESEKSRQALRTLHPLFALRYSATHRSSPNPVYRLSPFEAFRRNLVKRIQVCGVTESENVNRPFLALDAVSIGKGGAAGITARVRTIVNDGGRAREATIVLRQNDDLRDKTGRDEHADGYRVTEINAGDGWVEFENGARLELNGTSGPGRPEIFRAQIEKTIEQHLEMQARLRERGIKVLSLFFIDRVANYVEDDGLIKRLFDAAFDRLKRRDERFERLKPEDIRRAYFARGKGKSGQENAIDTEGRNAAEREAEKAAFALIMRDKERLLSFEEPVSFIFAHSALKEGWDNPNVFQICTLNQTVSEIKKRQEIGRGLRLAVDQTGERVFDEEVNVLTVVANESYQSYAATLQREYVDAGDAAPPPPRDAARKAATRNDRIYRDSPDFRAFWERLLRRVSYRARVDTPALVEVCVERLNRAEYPTPAIVIEKGRFVVTKFRMKLESAAAGKVRLEIETADTDGNRALATHHFKEGDNLGRVLKDDRLNGFQITAVRGAGQDAVVVFGNGVEVDGYSVYESDTEAGQKARERAVLEPELDYPVFNLLERAARETGLTRPTINAIFKSLRGARKRMLLKNPEGFAGVFIAEVNNALADHVTERIEFTPEDGRLDYDLEELFPQTRTFAQRELIDAGPRGLYDLVQMDSEVESRFVDVLKPDERVLFYFKFPPTYRVRLPRIIGNYNPDWGIARRGDDGRFTLHYVRETKGTLDLGRLQFPHERRKIVCAQKYFGAIDVDYRPITPDVRRWWEAAGRGAVQASLASA